MRRSSHGLTSALSPIVGMGEGLEHAPGTLRRLYKGENTGKFVIRLPAANARANGHARSPPRRYFPERINRKSQTRSAICSICERVKGSFPVTSLYSVASENAAVAMPMAQ